MCPTWSARRRRWRRRSSRGTVWSWAPSPPISSQAAGIVLSTNPTSGNKANKNSRVSLVVSAGPAVTVPNVVGKQLAAASQELQADKLRSNVVKYVASNKPTGTVLTQTPVAPQMVKSGTVVNLTVSGTQTVTQVPNVIGISPAAAGSLLTSNNLTVGNQTSVCSGNAGSGLVAGQSPAAGTQVPPNTPVNLQVSTGPCTAVVPSVVGDTQAQATAAIGGVSGLSATPTSVDCTASGGTPGTVQSQTPTGGATVNTPATVTINVCRAAHEHDHDHGADYDDRAKRRRGRRPRPLGLRKRRPPRPAAAGSSPTGPGPRR